MKIKNIIAGVVAAALAVSMTAVNAFASTVTLDSEYPGSWGMGASIPKAEFDAIGGDVKVVLTVETRNLLSDQFLINPINVVDSWVSISFDCTSDTVVGKSDGWFCIPENSTTVEFVVPADICAGLGENGLSFQVQNVTIKSAELSAGAPQGEIRRLGDADGKAYCFGATYEELTGTAPAADDAAPAATDAPAADNNTASSGTGNASAAMAVVVMAIAGTVAVTSKKRA